MLISTNTNQALHTALKIENDNNQLINSFIGTNNNKSLMNAFDDVEVEENTQSLLFEEKEKDINKISDNELDKLMSLEAEKISTEPKEVFKQDYTIKPKITDDIKDKELDDLFKDKKKG